MQAMFWNSKSMFFLNRWNNHHLRSSEFFCFSQTWYRKSVIWFLEKWQKSVWGKLWTLVTTSSLRRCLRCVERLTTDNCSKDLNTMCTNEKKHHSREAFEPTPKIQSRSGPNRGVQRFRIMKYVFVSRLRKIQRNVLLLCQWRQHFVSSSKAGNRLREKSL